MKKRKLFLGLILAMSMVGATLTGCGGGGAKTNEAPPADNSGQTAEKPGDTAATEDDFKLVLKLSHVFTQDEQLTKSMDLVAERIYDKTGGAIEIQTFPNGQLATYKDGVEQVVRGADFISVEDPSYLGDYVPDFKALVGPMLYTSMDQYSEMIKTDLVQDMIDKVEEKGIKVLALNYMEGFRNLNTNKVIEKPEDLKGMKLRVPGSQLFIDTMNAMGAVSTPIPFSETISGVQQGVVDGLEGTEASFVTNNLDEITKNIAYTKHFLGTVGVYISTDVWAKIPEKYQTIIQEEYTNGAEEMIDLIKKSQEETVKDLEAKGVSFNEVDTEAFVKATAKVYDTMEGITPGIYEKLLEEVEKMK